MDKMDKDDTKRTRNGVVACLRDISDGQTRLIFDDVISESEDRDTTWTFHYFYTFATLNRTDLESMDLPDEVYKEIGQNLVMRLLDREKRLNLK